MSDPANVSIATGLVALATAMMGPLAGPYAIVLVASSAGAFIAASETRTKTRYEVMVFVLRGAAFAVAFAALLAEWAERHFGWPSHSMLAAASVGIGYQAHQVRRLVPQAIRRFFRVPNPDAEPPARNDERDPHA